MRPPPPAGRGTTPELWIATGNACKLRELERLLAELGVRLRSPAGAGLAFAPVEDQPDFAGNARQKARALAALVDGVALADDSGLCVDALDGRPGVLSARYGGPHLDDAGRVQHLLAELRSVPAGRRTARFVCHLCLCGPDGTVRQTVEESCAGVLTTAPRGSGGFGYDPIFVPDACRGEDPAPTFAELDPARKDALSHRGRALRALRERLRADPALLAPRWS